MPVNRPIWQTETLPLAGLLETAANLFLGAENFFGPRRGAALPEQADRRGAGEAKRTGMELAGQADQAGRPQRLCAMC